ncbi:hypothetical protein ABXS75_05965 [Roseburia hominis]
MREDNIAMLQETLQIMRKGSYSVNGKTVKLKLSEKEMEAVHVLLPEIIRDENGKLLEDTVVVAALTCAAPMVRRGKEGLSESEYQKLVYTRIMGMHEKGLFRRIDFAVLDRTKEQYNFKEFYRNFSFDNFFGEEN